MPVVSRFGAAVASTLLLLAPAIWNRFPLLQYDTGGYFVRWYEGYLVPSRSTVLAAGTQCSWPCRPASSWPGWSGSCTPPSWLVRLNGTA